MRYLDFTLQLSMAGEGSYRVAVTESLAGFPAAQLTSTLDLAEIVAATSSCPSEGPAPANSLEVRKLADPQGQLGIPLFERLFVAGVGSAFTNSRTNIRVRRSTGEDCALRLRLHFGQPAAEAPHRNADLKRDLIRLASLPWEYLCDPDTGKFLALEGSLPIVRRMDTRVTGDLPTVEPPIRLLVASCQPQNVPEVDLTAELEALTAALPDSFEIHPLSNPSLDEVDAAMRKHKPHIFHFMGHGGFDNNRGVGYLCFVGPDGRAERQTGEQIADRLAEHTTLRLAVLNACRPGQLPRLPEQNPFAATATALLASGVPAVVAMQFPISNDAAVAFSRGFYSALPAQEEVEVAVYLGRREIHKKESISWEFGTPALYLQAQDGKLFKPRVDRDDEDWSVKLAIQSFPGFGKQHAAKCDAVLDLTSFFDKRFSRTPATWNEQILPRLIRFLSTEVREDRDLDLVINAHQSLAFTAGYLLEAKAGIKPNFYQRGQGSSYEKRPWNKDEGSVPEGELWQPFERSPRDADSTDLALAFSITQRTLPAVERYLEEKKLAVKFLYHAEVSSPGHDSVKSGAHAYGLAHALHLWLYGQSELRGGTLHLFGSAPNAFLFFLGQHAAPWGRIQLYEFDYSADRHGTYEPSILLDRSQLPRLGSPEGIDFLFT